MRWRARPVGPAAEAYARAALPGPRTSWREARWAVVDLETTGLDLERDEIISLAVVPIDEGRVRPGEALYRLVRPVRMPEADSIRIHGIRPADLARAAPMAERRDELLAALTGRLVVAHAAAVERGFLGPVLDEVGVSLRGPVLDTRELARVWLADREPGRAPARLDLSDLAGRLGLPAHRPHHALGDALTTAQVFLALAAHLEHRGRLTVRDLRTLQQGIAQRHR